MSFHDESIERATAPQPALAQEAAPEVRADANQPSAQAAPPVAAAPVTKPEMEPAHGPQGVQFVISVLVIVVFMITFVIQAFRVPSESMEKTLLIGDFLLADKLHFANDGGMWHWLLPYRPIRRGDIVVFRYPVDPSQYFVKRVIGLPGDRIHLQNKRVFVNGSQLEENYVIHSLPSWDPYRDNFPMRGATPLDVDRHWRATMPRYIDRGELLVPAGQYFVMGDNRDRSSDSRYWGFVPRGNIMGRPLVIYLSVNDATASRPAVAPSDGKLFGSGQVLAHFLQFARWDRIFRRVL